MPIWPRPLKKTRSPGSSWSSGTGVPTFHIAYEECGRETPSCAYAYMTRPEQSKPDGDAPAQTYGTPTYDSATPTTPSYFDAGSTLAPSGVRADAPTTEFA